MENTSTWPQKKKFIWGGCVATALLCIAILCPKVADAKVCFLPSGKCLEDGKAGHAGDSIKPPVNSDTCTGYNLTAPTCTGDQSVCGWDCTSCKNKKGTFYKCVEKPMPSGCTRKLVKCTSDCNNYTMCGYVGGDKTGKCTPIGTGYTTTKPGHCINYDTKTDSNGKKCYKSNGNIVPNSDLTSNAPGSCKIYSTGSGTDGVPCYYGISAMPSFSTTNPGSCYDVTQQAGSNGTMCYRKDGDKACAGSYSVAYQSVADCGVGGSTGWTFSENGCSGTKKCGKCTEKNGCGSGYTTDKQSVGDCGEGGATGWNFDQSGYTGNVKCGRCVAKNGCTTGYSTSIQTAANCGEGGATGWDVVFSGYNGNTKCGKCVAKDGCTSGYTTDKQSVNDCGAGGATGWTFAQSGYNGNTKCGKCTAKNGCASGYDSGKQTVSDCGTGSWEVTFSGYNGNLQCGKCVAKSGCTSGYNTSIQTAADCGAGGSTGWNVEFSGYTGATKCGKCVAKNGCASGYTTDKQSASDCGVGGSTGWTFAQSGYNGNTKCGKCTAKNGCASGYDSSIQSASDCGTGSWTISSSGYYGNTTCGKCVAESNCDSGYSTSIQSAANCGDGGSTGWNVSFSGYVGSMKCGKCTAKNGCGSGYTTDKQSVSDCGSSGSTGWTFAQSGYNGNTKCGKCTAKNGCGSGYTIDKQSVSDCGSSGATGWSFTQSGYNGDTACGKCTELSCKSGYEAGKTCGSGFTRVVDSTRKNGDVECAKCECNKTCDAGYSLNTSTCSCVAIAGCSDYTLTSKTSGCYTCTESPSNCNYSPKKYKCTSMGTGWSKTAPSNCYNRETATAADGGTCYKQGTLKCTSGLEKCVNGECVDDTCPDSSYTKGATPSGCYNTDSTPAGSNCYKAMSTNCSSGYEWNTSQCKCVAVAGCSDYTLTSVTSGCYTCTESPSNCNYSPKKYKCSSMGTGWSKTAPSGCLNRETATAADGGTCYKAGSSKCTSSQTCVNGTCKNDVCSTGYTKGSTPAPAGCYNTETTAAGSNCYQYKCSSAQICYSNACCTPAANETQPSSGCYTKSTPSNGCGGTYNKYTAMGTGWSTTQPSNACYDTATSAASGSPTCYKVKDCGGCSNSYVTSCSAGCTSGTKTTCTLKQTLGDGTKCYQKTETSCSSGQVCYGGDCCTPIADENRPTSGCYSNSGASDGCGGSRRTYTSMGSGWTTTQPSNACYSTAVNQSTASTYCFKVKDCGGCSNSSWVTSCSAGCSNGVITSCTLKETLGDGTKCYQKTTTSCSSGQVCYSGNCCTPTADGSVPTNYGCFVAKTASNGCGGTYTYYEGMGTGWSTSGANNGCYDTQTSAGSGTPTCYKYKCSSGQTCYNGHCCTPTADQSIPSNYGCFVAKTASNGCGGTYTYYEGMGTGWSTTKPSNACYDTATSAGSGTPTCYKTKTCTCSNSSYVTNNPAGCASNSSYYTYTLKETLADGTKCYLRSTANCGSGTTCSGGSCVDNCAGYTSSVAKCDDLKQICCDQCADTNSANYGKYYCPSTCTGTCKIINPVDNCQAACSGCRSTDSDCKSANGGNMCISMDIPDSNGIYIRCYCMNTNGCDGGTTCAYGCNTAKNSVSDCGSTGSSGWTYTSCSGIGCGGKCTPKSCATNYSTTCTGSQSGYSGNSPCKYCGGSSGGTDPDRYGCFSTLAKCQAAGYSCTKRTDCGETCLKTAYCPTNWNCQKSLDCGISVIDDDLEDPDQDGRICTTTKAYGYCAKTAAACVSAQNQANGGSATALMCSKVVPNSHPHYNAWYCSEGCYAIGNLL